MDKIEELEIRKLVAEGKAACYNILANLLNVEIKLSDKKVEK